MVQDYNFRDIAEYALRYSTELIPELLPGGHLIGHEWVCGSKHGGPGDSMKANMENGRWADFATEERGLDLLSLVACVKGLKMIDAAKWLVQRINYPLIEVPKEVKSNGFKRPPPMKPNPNKVTICKPPKDLVPDMIHFRHGKPSHSWAYRDEDGDVLYYVARYKIPGGGKEFAPWSYCLEDNKFIMRSWPQPRPLYNLDKLKENPTKPVLIVEGEKSVDGAEGLGASKNYVVVTWPNGANSINSAEWGNIKGRYVTIWPDGDDAGRTASVKIAEKLQGIAKSVKIIEPDRDDGWDAWDAFEEEWTWERVVQWAKERIVVHTKREPEAITPEVVDFPKTKKAEITVRQDDNRNELTEAEKEEMRSMGVVMNQRGKPFQSIANIAAFLQCVDYLKGHFWFDEFDYRCYTDIDGHRREVSDSDVVHITVYIQRSCNLPTIGTSLVHDAVNLYCRNNSRHSVREWVDKIEWDGTPRVGTFFIDCLGVEDTAFSRAVSHNFWVGMMARAYKPGCKNDYMVVLEGPQGIGKSMALSAIGRKWHTESTESVGSKDFYQNLHGKLIVEIAELDSFTRAEVTRVKQCITCTFDRFRPSYGRTSNDYQRQCIFVGTTNESNYLRDATGARRFWPLKCGQIKIDKINEERDQLFAEALALFKRGNPWHVVPMEEAIDQQELRYQHDEIEIRIREYMAGKNYIVMADLARDALDIGTDKLDIRQQRRIGTALRRMGWHKERETINGNREYVWRKEGSPPLAFSHLGDEVGFSG